MKNQAKQLYDISHQLTNGPLILTLWQVVLDTGPVEILIFVNKILKIYLFYNDYKTSYTTYINRARWHQYLHSDGLRVGGNRNTRRKPTGNHAEIAL